MAQIAPKGQSERQSFTLMKWSGGGEWDTRSASVRPAWYRIWVVLEDTNRGWVKVYHQKITDAPPFLMPMPPDDRWQTLNYATVNASELMYTLESWGLKASRPQIERAEDV